MRRRRPVESAQYLAIHYTQRLAEAGAVARWKETDYPTIAAEAKATGGTVFFVDGAVVRSDYHAGTTRAPLAQTPAVRPTGARFGGNMISAISAQGALRLYRLPAYSPPLNPDEWVWNNVKHDGVAPAAVTGPEQIKAVVTARLRRLQRLPHLVRGFFDDPELAYITAVA